GCDGSVLLDGSASEPSDKDAPPNLTLRAQAFVIIENLRRLVHKACGLVVSCSDITALAARDAVALSGGPNYNVPLGRRDGLTFATRNITLANLPPPFAKTNAILNSLSQKGFAPTDYCDELSQEDFDESFRAFNLGSRLVHRQKDSKYCQNLCGKRNTILPKFRECNDKDVTIECVDGQSMRDT
ncbi:hypothetical protein R6Q59_031657, partial [Mikania micrantha]